jgi:transcriptional regulator with XRE-family HTH domain
MDESVNSFLENRNLDLTPTSMGTAKTLTAREILYRALTARAAQYGRQEDFAEAMGVSHGQMNRWLTGNRPFNPTLDLVEQLMGRMAIHPASIFDGAELPAPAPVPPPVALETLDMIRGHLAKMSAELGQAIKGIYIHDSL